MYKDFKIVSNKFSSWESKGLSNEKISFSPNFLITNLQAQHIFSGDFLRQDKVTYNHGPIVKVYIVYRLTPFTTNTKSAALENCLFDAAILTKNDDIDQYKYSGYGIGFDSRGTFSHPSRGFGKNVITFGADLSSSVHANNKTRNILVLRKDFIQGIDDATIYAEKMYSTNSTRITCLLLQ